MRLHVSWWSLGTTSYVSRTTTRPERDGSHLWLATPHRCLDQFEEGQVGRVVQRVLAEGSDAAAGHLVDDFHLGHGRSGRPEIAMED
jgi:hypothetical protein